MYPGLIVLTLILFGPSSQAMLLAIWRTADFDVLYDTHGWPCTIPGRPRQHFGVVQCEVNDLVRSVPADARNHYNAAAVPEPVHLLSGSLGGV